MADVKMYCTSACPYCRMAIKLLEKRGVAIRKIQVDQTPGKRDEMTQITGRTTVPQIFIGDTHVGGYAELAELDMDDQLLPMLST